MCFSKITWSVFLQGGQKDSPGASPWQVILLNDDGLLCVGSLITDQWVLTSGRCMAKYEPPRIKSDNKKEIYMHNNNNNFSIYSLNLKFLNTLNISNNLSLFPVMEPTTQ